MGTMKNQLVLLLLIWASLVCLSASLLDDFSITGHDPEILTSEKRVVELFHAWKLKHQKVYKYAEEVQMRLENFKKSLKYIIEKNSKTMSTKKGHVVGLNKFADMSNEEFREVYVSKVRKPADLKRNKQTRRMQGKVSSCEAPASLDWRKKGAVTGVKDQGDCGSSWAFSSTGAMEGIHAIVTGDLVSLSEQELVDCDPINYGCDGGYMNHAFEWVMSNGGINTDSSYPYTSVDATCNVTKEEKFEVLSIDGYEDVEASESGLLCATVNQPISVAIHGSSYDFQLYTSGVYDGDCSSDPGDIDHAVLIVGYGSEDGQDYWIVKNSWGTSWGMDGYIYIQRNSDLPYGVCAINDMASHPTKDSSSAPSPAVAPQPPPSPPPPSTTPSPPPPTTPSPPPPTTPSPPPPTPPSPPPPTPSSPPPPTPPSPPPPTPPPHPIPPPPGPGPWPSQCGDFSYCPPGHTCCCKFKILDYCLIHECCEYYYGVCCNGSDYCCPHEFPICVFYGLCLRNRGDYFGIAAKKRTMAKHKLPWSKPDQTPVNQPLQWKRNQFAAMR